MIEVTRQQVLAYRTARHGFDRSARSATDLAVLDLGVQDTPPGSARLAIAARTPVDVDVPTEVATGALTLAWSLRGAPHLHRSAQLPWLAGALWPFSDHDALARMGWRRSRMAEAGMPALTAYRQVIEAMRTEITQPTVKGAASAGVTQRIPAGLSTWCRGCQATHVYESLFRAAALPAGRRLEYDQSPASLAPIAGWPGAPGAPAGTADLITTYLRLLGPASLTEVTGWLVCAG